MNAEDKPARHRLSMHAIARAALAVIFLVALVIMAVSNQILTAAFQTPMRCNRLYHEKVLRVDLVVRPGLPFHVLSVKISPLPIRGMGKGYSIIGCI